MAQPILEVTGLRVEASHAKRGAAEPAATPLLDGVELTVHAGEVVGLIGESGAGKSTLGLAALGYTRPGCSVTAGRVLFEGVDLMTMPPAQLRQWRGARIAYIAQSSAASFNPSQRLGKQVAEVLVLHRAMSWPAALARAAVLFAELDLPSPQTFGARYPHQVSGGQLQRAMIAMAMACEPRLLVLDEPTTALDVTTQVEVLAAIRATLRRHGAAALYISHDLALVAQLADRMTVLRHGRVVESGTAAQIIGQPVADYTRRLLGALSSPATSSVTKAAGGIDQPRAASSPSESRLSAPASAPALSVTSLTASYRQGPPVIKDVSLAIAPGKTLAIVGASGSGKSSLARAICGLLAPQAGEVRLAGTLLPSSFHQRSRDQLRRVQLVYQQPETALNPGHRIDRILGRVVEVYTGGSRSQVQTRVAQLLDMVGLPTTFAQRKPRELSGGQIQRIGIARALAAEPDVIVCDEVTSALDPLVAVDILNLLQTIQQHTGLAYLFITHDIGVVRRIADDVAVMCDGSFVASGPLQQVFQAPMHPYTEFLLSCVPQMRTDWLTETLADRPDRPDRPSLQDIELMSIRTSLARPGAAAR